MTNLPGQGRRYEVDSGIVVVKSGHVTPRDPVVQFGFSNPERPHLGLDVVDFRTLRARLSPESVAAVHRADFQQVFLFTGGAAFPMVDFGEHPCTDPARWPAHPHSWRHRAPHLAQVRFLIRDRDTSPYADRTVSAESSTNINMPLELHGWFFRHAQGHTSTSEGVRLRSLPLGPVVTCHV
ncbi:hypothetical protein [Kutzneria sp. 744]|uniref:hypothetical protein n=1 Tax=Kutzneria sp. (strain 744) TaxID=345341 RepID=UPI0012FB21E3|nr:hypothetical protein [Kutzneria sp. 744]